MPATYDNHRAQLKAILLGWGMPEDNAETTSEILSWADLHGVDSHGISMIPGYDGLRRSGRAKMDVRPRVVKETPVSAVVDGGGGLGHVPAHFAMATAIGKAKSVGVGIAVVKHSAHFGAAERALNHVLLRAPNHPRAHMLLGAVQIRTNRAAKGITECRRALTLDRNLADAHGFIGLGKYALGRGEEVETHIQEALRLSPRDTRAFLWFMIVGMAKLLADADIEALDWLRRSIEANANFALAHFHLAGAHAMLADLKEARCSAEAGLVLDPGFSIRRYDSDCSFLSGNSAWLSKRERFYEGMRLAGVPEG